MRRPLRRSGSALTAASLATLITVGAGGPSSADVSCGALDGFTRLSGGVLYRLQDATLLGTPNTLRETSAVGSGWGSFAWTGAGGDGVLYALTSTGKLLWFRYDTATSTWMKGSGGVVGTAFVPGSKVINIAVGAKGWLYVVRADGRLVLYRHTGRLTGTATWAESTGLVIGTGWTGNDLIAPQGDGTVYRQVSGVLYWFRHSDPTVGPVTWVDGGRPAKIGVGWRFYDLLALGGGVLLATSSPSGDVSVYRHTDPVGGSATWSVTALKKYVARADSFGVTASPATCS